MKQSAKKMLTLSLQPPLAGSRSPAEITFGELVRRLFAAEKAISKLTRIHCAPPLPSAPAEDGGTFDSDHQLAQKIIFIVGAETNFEVHQIRARCRTSRLSWIRFALTAILYQTTGLVTTDIALHLGYKDHSSVLYALTEVRDRMAVDPAWRDEFQRLLAIVLHDLQLKILRGLPEKGERIIPLSPGERAGVRGSSSATPPKIANSKL